MHAADHGHDGQPPVPGDAAPVDLEGARVHPRLLDHESAVTRGAEADLRRDLRHQGRHGEHSHHARRQQVRRNDARGVAERRHGAVEAVELCLHGDVGEDEPQREGTLPGAAATREAPLHESAVGQQEVEVAEATREAKGQVRGHVRQRGERTGVATRDGAAMLCS